VTRLQSVAAYLSAAHGDDLDTGVRYDLWTIATTESGYSDYPHPWDIVREAIVSLQFAESTS
jgi:hypothetical protein